MRGNLDQKRSQELVLVNTVEQSVWEAKNHLCKRLLPTPLQLMALWLKKEWMGDGKLLKHQNIPDCIVETKQVNMWGGVCQRARSYEMYRCLLGLYLLNSELKK